MTERELVSVNFQGTKAGGLIERVFGRDGLDETSVDRCELFTVEHGRHVNRSMVLPQDETMGRLRSARIITAWMPHTPAVAQAGGWPPKTAQRPRISWQSNNGLRPSIASTTSSTVISFAGRARQ